MIDLTGTWITSFFSLVHDDPIDSDHPAAQLAGYARNIPGSPEHFKQVAGYFPAATLLCLRFKPDLTLLGDVKINRGGTKRVINPDPDPDGPVGPVGGHYEPPVWNPDLHVHEGKFFTIYPVGGDKQLEYRYIVRDANALEWIWWNASTLSSGDPFRASVARGTLTRVLFPGP